MAIHTTSEPHVHGVLHQVYPHMTSVFRDEGSGADLDLEVYGPRDQKLSWVGQVAQQGYGPFPQYVLALIDIEARGFLRPPQALERVWRNDGGGPVFSCWRPVPPSGFRVLGHLITRGDRRPELPSLVCVKAALCGSQPAELGPQFWSDSGTGATDDIVLRHLASRDGEVKSHAFVGACEDRHGLVYNLLTEALRVPPRGRKASAP